MKQRKELRLREYDYSGNGAYFVTICTQNREKLFARPEIHAESIPQNGEESFSAVGADSISARIIRRTFAHVINEHPNVSCPRYVIMQDHFHALVVLERADTGSAPTLPYLIQAFKRFSTLEYTKAVKAGLLPPYDKRIWQRGYYEHVIRSYDDFLDCWTYIENNPLKQLSPTKDEHI